MELLTTYLPQFLLFGSVLWFYVATLIFIAFLFYTDVNEMGYQAAVGFMAFILLLQFQSTFVPVDYFSWSTLGLYLGIGFVHSLLRTYFYGRKKLKYNGYHKPETDKEKEENIKSQIKDRKSYLKGNVFRWWFMFPISFLNWVLSDLMKDAYDVIYKQLNKLYEAIFNMGLKSAKEELEQ